MAYIAKGIGGFYYVKTAAGLVECRARGIFRKQGIVPLAGDNVVLSDDNRIETILPRRNYFPRPPVANLDILLVVASTVQPVPSTLILDKLFCAAEYLHIQPVLVVTKLDLGDAKELCAAYKDSGIPMLFMDYHTGSGLVELGSLIAGHLCALCGNSGVGKSTLLNALEPHLVRETGEISQKLGRGRHTTREVEIFEICGGRIADTPGFASVDAQKIGHIPKQELDTTFPEFARYLGKCRYAGCSHRKERGCAVRNAVEGGAISQSRYKSYLSMYEEAEQYKEWEHTSKTY